MPALVVAAILLASFAIQAVIAARRDSVTIDEFVHLPVGLYALYTGDLRPDPINPPHTRMIAALALLPHPPAFDPKPGMPHWSMGYLFMQRNAQQYQHIFVRGRTMIIALAVLLGIVVFWWSFRLYGESAALAASFLFAFSPAMLAHGHLVTLDLAGGLGFALTAWATWEMLAAPSLLRALVVGIALGVATLLKLSGFVLIAVVVVLILIRALTERRRNDPAMLAWMGLLAASGLATLLVINLGYRFDGTFEPLGQARLAPAGLLASLAERYPWLRLPLPIPLVDGIDMILNVGREREPSYFLAGELSSEGWWYYHLAAWALKTPLPLVLLVVASLCAWMVGRAPGLRAYCVFVPIVLLFAGNSAFNSLQIGVRHVLSAYPLMFVAAAPWLAWALRPPWRRHRRVRAALAVAGMAWYALGTLAVAPRYLQYFNELAGGANGGHRMLIDSNIDWGQDLIRLSDYMRDNGLERINLAYFGRVDPRVYGIDFVPLESPRQHGPTAVSATFLMGRPYFWYRRGRMGWVNHGTYSWLQQHEPVGRAGAIFIYDLP